jgi:hypothetical protein
LAQEFGREAAQGGAVKFGRFSRIDRHCAYIARNADKESRT